MVTNIRYLQKMSHLQQKVFLHGLLSFNSKRSTVTYDNIMKCFSASILKREMGFVVVAPVFLFTRAENLYTNILSGWRASEREFWKFQAACFYAALLSKINTHSLFCFCVLEISFQRVYTIARRQNRVSNASNVFLPIFLRQTVKQ